MNKITLAERFLDLAASSINILSNRWSAFNFFPVLSKSAHRWLSEIEAPQPPQKKLLNSVLNPHLGQVIFPYLLKYFPPMNPMLSQAIFPFSLLHSNASSSTSSGKPHSL